MRTHRPTRAAALVAALALASAALAGCSPPGPPRGEVRGKVTFKGAAVTEGLVTFLDPKEGGGAEAQIGPDGSYEVAGGVVVGEYIVVINPPVHMVDTDPGKSPPAPVEKPAPNIPQRYRQQGSTTLRATVKEGTNEINFEMKP